MGGMVGDARKRQKKAATEQVLAAPPAPDAASLDAVRAQYRGQVREAYDEVDRLRVRIRQLLVDLERESARSGSLVAEARRQAARAGRLEVQRDEIRANRDELARKVAEQRASTVQVLAQQSQEESRLRAALDEARSALAQYRTAVVDEIRVTSIYQANLPGLLRAAELLEIPPADDAAVPATTNHAESEAPASADTH